MKHTQFISMTVGELAFAMRIKMSVVKQAAQANRSNVCLDGPVLDETLDRLKIALNFHSKGWDLSLLDGCKSEWESSLLCLYSLPVSFPASMPPSQGRQIKELILREAPRRVLEIGCFIGISSHWIASALKEIGDGHLDSVDTFLPKYPNRRHFSYLADPYSLATISAKEAGLGEFIQFHCSDSVGFSRSISLANQYDFIFIDGDHTFNGVARDFLAYFPLLRKGGIILLHDTNPKYCGWDGPRRLIDEVLMNSPSVTIEEIETQPNFGMAVVRKISDVNIEMGMWKSMTLNIRLALHNIKDSMLGFSLSRVILRNFIKPLIVYLRYR